MLVACVFVFTVGVIVANFIADIIYPLLDPRITLGEGGLSSRSQEAKEAPHCRMLSRSFGLVTAAVFVTLALLEAAELREGSPLQPVRAQLRLRPTLSSFTRPTSFGTDFEGRDIFSQVIAALPVDMGISIAVVAILRPSWNRSRAPWRAYFRGFFDEVIMRLTDMFLAFPR